MLRHKIGIFTQKHQLSLSFIRPHISALDLFSFQGFLSYHKSVFQDDNLLISHKILALKLCASFPLIMGRARRGRIQNGESQIHIQK